MTKNIFKLDSNIMIYKINVATHKLMGAHWFLT